MKLSLLRTFYKLTTALLVAVGVAVPLGLMQIPFRGFAPVLFYFSLVLLLMTLTLSRLGIFFAGLVRDRAGQTQDTPQYVSGITDRFVWPSAAFLFAGCLLFAVSFVVQVA